MRRVMRRIVPAVFAILLGQSVPAADAPKPAPSKRTVDPGKVNSLPNIRIDKEKLMINKPTGGPDPDFPPPAGAILDLNGTPMPGTGFQHYTVNFSATLSGTAITFAFRSDPGAVILEQVSVTDLAGGGNLLTNGDFSGGGYGATGDGLIPNGWTYTNPNNASVPGYVGTSSCGGATPNNCWIDPSVSAYDTISQTITTTPGHTYQISFYLTHGDSGTFCITSAANCGSVIDALVYAQGAAAPNRSVPALSTTAMWMMALLLLAAGLVQLRRGFATR